MKRRTSQLVLAPRTPVRMMSEASGGRARYGSRSGGIGAGISIRCLRMACADFGGDFPSLLGHVTLVIATNDLQFCLWAGICSPSS